MLVCQEVKEQQLTVVLYELLEVVRGKVAKGSFERRAHFVREHHACIDYCVMDQLQTIR